MEALSPLPYSLMKEKNENRKRLEVVVIWQADNRRTRFNIL